MDTFKIATDSSSDVLTLGSLPFASAPLKIITAKREFVDDAALDVGEMVDFLTAYKGQSSTSCPNPEDWLTAFGEAQYVFCVTITARLSGSYNAAVAAKMLYEEAHPERRVYVINSLSAGPELRLILEKLARCVHSGMTYDQICRTIDAYTRQTGVVFMLESMKNLSNNGRVSPLVAKAAGLLGIRVVGKASDKGDLQPLDKCRGQERAIASLVEHLHREGYAGGRVRIAHCFNRNAAERLAEQIRARFPQASAEIYECRGLCSYYAERGGMLVGFEKG